MDQEDIFWAEMFMDGTNAKEIEHLLMMKMHPLNTVKEIRQLQEKIHTLMMDMYNRGQAREKDK